MLDQKKDSFFYSWLFEGNEPSGQAEVSRRARSLLKSHHLVGNFFHYRTAIKILGWDYEDVFEQGRLDLNPQKWADFGPLNFQMGPPQGVAKALKKAAVDRNIMPYPPNLIPALKQKAAEAIFQRQCCDDFEIIGTEGAQAALAYSILTFVNSGDEVVITDQGYFFLEPPILMAGGRVRRIKLCEANGFRMDARSLRRILTRRTRMVIVCDPVNPFGTIQTKDELKGIAAFAKKHDIIILNNITHCFHRLNPKARHYPMSALCNSCDNILTIAGLSHGFGMAGLRIGFLGGHPRLVGPVLAIKSALTRINLNLIMQEAALAALSDTAYFKRAQCLLTRNLQRLREIVASEKRLRAVVAPDYGFFACLDTSGIKASCQELTVALLKRHCAVYPADGLGMTDATSYIRVNFSSPFDFHFEWFRKALPEAIREAELRVYREPVIAFFERLKTKRSQSIMADIRRIK